MEDTRFYERIDKIEDIGILSELVCKEYNIGNYEETKLVEIGYEDFNAIITTSLGKYFMKVYNNSRTDEEVKDVIERAYVAEQNGVKAPKVYKNSHGEIVARINYKNSCFRLSLMEYIDGKNFYELGKEATDEELLKIADLASEFGNIDYKPTFIYDSWAISNFITEYEKKKNIISPEYLKYIEPIYDEFKSFDYQSLPKSFTHGDIILTNVIKDKNNDFWVVDYSVSNYTVRLNEIAVASNDFGIIDENKQESEKRIKMMLDRWAHNVSATEAERKAVQLLFRVENAIYILNPSYEIAKGNDSKENRMYLEMGKFGLTLNVEINS